MVLTPIHPPETNHWIQVVITATSLKDPKRTVEGRCPANTVAHQLTFQVVKAPKSAKGTTTPTQGGAYGAWSLLKLCDDM